MIFNKKKISYNKPLNSYNINYKITILKINKLLNN